MNNPKATREPQATPDELKERLLSCGSKMFVFPAVAAEALEITKNTNCSMSELACLVERDGKLATEILSLANSVLFSVGSPLTSIHHSLVRLGMKRCRNLILSTCVSGMMKNISLQQEWIRELLWQHSFTTASACLYLNRTFGLGFQGEEFTAGLLHDFGRTLFAVVSEDKFQIADALDFNEENDVLTRETEILGINHCELGSWFATHKKLPEAISEVIRWHHDPARENEHQKLIALTAAGDHIANHIQRFEEAAGYAPEANKGIEVMGQLYGKNFNEHFAEISEQMVADVIEMAVVNQVCSQRIVQ